MTDNVVTIDGPAASGKSAVASKLAETLRIPYLSTGLMYRAVTWLAMERGISVNPPADKEFEGFLRKTSLKCVRDGGAGFDIVIGGESPGAKARTPEVTAAVSAVSALPSVRAWLLDKQRDAAADGMLVAEGRDMGTVVFPDSKHKFFLTAAPRVRALRRLRQKGETFDSATLDSVESEIQKRDETDMKRAAAPLKKADDAVYIDNSDMTIDETVNLMVSHISRRG
jgi:cytidylate kinase